MHIPDEAVEAALQEAFKNLSVRISESSMRAALSAALPIILGKPVAWYVPHLISFKHASRTSCPEHLQPEFEGTVAWGVELFGDDSLAVTDKQGVTHKPCPLYALKEPQP